MFSSIPIVPSLTIPDYYLLPCPEVIIITYLLMNKTEKQIPINQTDDESSKNFINELFKWGSIVFIIWILYCFAYNFVPTWITEKLPIIFREDGRFQIGAFGDYFGALNTLFAGLAFAGIIVTIRQQSADLQATKYEMRNQTAQFERQNLLSKLSQIKEEVHNRLNWVKQLEKDIELPLHKREEIHVYRGAQALNELTSMLDEIVLTLFPDEDYTDKTPNLNLITDDYMHYYVAFQYTTSWINSICTLLDDMHAYFLELKRHYSAQEDLIKEIKDAENRYFRAVINSFHIAHIAFIYAHYDTLFTHPIIEHLRSRNLINTHLLHSRFLDKNKRNALGDLFTNFDPRTPIHSIFTALNRWRAFKGWPDCEKIQVSNTPKDHDGYFCSLDTIKEDKVAMKAIKNSTLEIFTLYSGSIQSSKINVTIPPLFHHTNSSSEKETT